MKKDIISILKNSKVTHPLFIAAKESNRYWKDFLDVNDNYKKFWVSMIISNF